MTLQKEANLRFALVRIRENCESIAFYGGHAAEATYVQACFAVVITTLQSVINWTSLLALWRNLYTYATILVPSAVTAPKYFAGEIQFGVVTQVRTVFLCEKMIGSKECEPVDGHVISKTLLTWILHRCCHFASVHL